MTGHTKSYDVVIVGGGAAGISVAAGLVKKKSGLNIALVEMFHGLANSNGERIKYAEQGIRVTLVVTGNQLGIVEIVTTIHAHAVWQSAAHDDFLFCVEQ